MTPEELNRTIEFIIASQARAAALQEKDEEELRRQDQVDRRLARMTEMLADRFLHHDERMERMDNKYEDWQKRDEHLRRDVLELQRETMALQRETLDLQRETLELQREALRLLRDISQRLPPLTVH